MRQIHREIALAVRNKANFVRRGTNAQTNAKGIMYEVYVVGNIVRVFYWGTPIVTFHGDLKVLTFYTGGFFTKTTKDVMNAVLDEVGADFRISQVKREWKMHKIGPNATMKDAVPFQEAKAFPVQLFKEESIGA